MFVIQGLYSGGVEGQVWALLKHLDRRYFAPMLVLLDVKTLARAESCVERILTLESVCPDATQGATARLRNIANRTLALARILREHRPDILHNFLLGHQAMIGCTAGSLAHVPIVIGSRRSSPTQYRHSRVGTFVERAALRMTDFMVGNSFAVTRELTELDGYDARRATTIYNGVDCARFQPKVSSEARRRFAWSNEHVILGMVANFRSCKRHTDLIEAVRLLHGKHPQVRLLMAGSDSGALRQTRDAVNHAGIEHICHIVTGEPAPEFVVYPSIDIYVCTSESEGFSNVLLEAMACGKPVVATDVGGNAEAVRHGLDGFIIPPLAPELVAKAVEPLINDIQLRHRLGQNGRERAVSTFSTAAMVRSYENYYTALLAKTQ